MGDLSAWETTAHDHVQVRFAGATVGFQVRVYKEEKLTEGRVRCEKCRRCFVATLNGEPWSHKCGSAPPWRILEHNSAYRLFGTRQFAYAAGLRRLAAPEDSQLPLPEVAV